MSEEGLAPLAAIEVVIDNLLELFIETLPGAPRTITFERPWL